MIKGYVKYYESLVPVTWEKEFDKYYYNVRKVIERNGKFELDYRIYDTKVEKNEVIPTQEKKSS